MKTNTVNDREGMEDDRIVVKGGNADADTGALPSISENAYLPDAGITNDQDFEKVIIRQCLWWRWWRRHGF